MFCTEHMQIAGQSNLLLPPNILLWANKTLQLLCFLCSGHHKTLQLPCFLKSGQKNVTIIMFSEFGTKSITNIVFSQFRTKSKQNNRAKVFGSSQSKPNLFSNHRDPKLFAVWGIAITFCICSSR